MQIGDLLLPDVHQLTCDVKHVVDRECHKPHCPEDFVTIWLDGITEKLPCRFIVRYHQHETCPYRYQYANDSQGRFYQNPEVVKAFSCNIFRWIYNIAVSMDVTFFQRFLDAFLDLILCETKPLCLLSKLTGIFSQVQQILNSWSVHGLLTFDREPPKR